LFDISVDQIKDDEVLFGGDLGLDSIDSVELIVFLDREYGIKINNPADGRAILIDVDTIVNYIEEQPNKIMSRVFAAGISAISSIGTDLK
jgi:acyl carrier protein